MVHVLATAFRLLRLHGVLLAIALSGSAADAFGQSGGTLTFFNRNGTNIGICGVGAGNIFVSHSFATPTPTDDSIVLSDPGKSSGFPVWGSSMADSHLIATPTPQGLTLAANGIAARDPIPPLGEATAAVADARDVWNFTLSESAHFTLNVSLSATSTEPVVSTTNYLFFGASITPDSGSPPPPYAAALSAPGTFTLAASGTLGPGQYTLSMQNRAASVFNSFPFTGSYQCSVTLAIQPLAVATLRNADPNPLSYTASLPILGQAWNGSIDLALTGHSFAQLFASSAATQVPLASGQVLLIDFPVLQLTPLLPGPLAGFSIPLPSDPGLAGVFLPTQALHVGGAPSFALSNAVDLTFGY
jgi:hypothetical protein